MKPAKLYIILTVTVFAALAAVFLFFPRSRYSELEKRELSAFPEFSLEKLGKGDYASELAKWFSDTEPYRDLFMQINMNVRGKLRRNFSSDEEAVTFHASPSGADTSDKGSSHAGSDNAHNTAADESLKIASAGIMVIGKEPNVRVLNAFGGGSGASFASAVTQYASELPGVKVYAMVIPLSSEFYTPEKAKKSTSPQKPFIDNTYSRLSAGAKGVDAYSALASHADEDIYLRTDHHWAPLGAYYAAQAFARSAGVPFKDLSAYDKHIVKRFVGSMYGYSKDIAVKNSPEDFVYYTPKNTQYTTLYRNYKVNSENKVTSESAPAKGPLFYKFKDGSGGAYSTFLGSDQRLTHIHTGAGNGRRLLIIKDSYGNPVPGYLLNSFEDIHVVDFRYFPRNMKKYVKDNNITDLLFCVNIFNANSGSIAAKFKHFLSQTDGAMASPTPAKEEEKQNEDPVKEETETQKAEQSEEKTTTTETPPPHCQ